MKKINANTLEAALTEAAKHFNCSLTQIEYEIVQNPSNGIFGFLKKEAIIIASKKEKLNDLKEQNITQQTSIHNNTLPDTKDTQEDSISSALSQKGIVNTNTKEQKTNIEANAMVKDDKDVAMDKDVLYFDDTVSIQTESAKTNFNMDITSEQADKHNDFVDDKKMQDNFDSFFYDKNSATWQDSVKQKPKQTKDIELACKEVRAELTELLHFLPLELSRIQVEPYDSHTIFILIDGLDAALLIGQKGYRYKSLSYLLFNWINVSYGYNVRLEIAQFLKNQEDMIRTYLEPIIETAKLQGKAQTKPLDGVLTHIALKMLRDALPNKYIVFRENADGEKYITISEFLNNNNARNSVNGFGNLPKY